MDVEGGKNRCTHVINLFKSGGHRSPVTDVPPDPVGLLLYSLSLLLPGTWSPSLCPPGTFTPQDVSGLQEESGCSICPPGHYCRSVKPRLPWLFACPVRKPASTGGEACSPSSSIFPGSPGPQHLHCPKQIFSYLKHKS